MNTMLPKDGEDNDQEEVNTSDKYYSQWNCCKKSILNLQIRCSRKLINRCCTCLKMNRRKRMLYSNNLNQLEKEIHITHIVQTVRTLKAAVRKTISNPIWNKLYKDYSKLDGHYSDDDFEMEELVHDEQESNVVQL